MHIQRGTLVNDYMVRVRNLGATLRVHFEKLSCNFRITMLVTGNGINCRLLASVLGNLNRVVLSSIIVVNPAGNHRPTIHRDTIEGQIISPCPHLDATLAKGLPIIAPNTVEAGTIDSHIFQGNVLAALKNL